MRLGDPSDVILSLSKDRLPVIVTSVSMLPFAVPAFLENSRDLELIGLVLAVVFWLQMIRLCYTREPFSPGKVAWLLFMIAVPGLGSLFYFFFRVARR